LYNRRFNIEDLNAKFFSSSLLLFKKKDKKDKKDKNSNTNINIRVENNGIFKPNLEEYHALGNSTTLRQKKFLLNDEENNIVLKPILERYHAPWMLRKI